MAPESATAAKDGSRRRGRRQTFAAVAVIGSGLLVLVLVEIGLRMFGVRPERYPAPRWLVSAGGQFHERGLWGEGLIKVPGRFASDGFMMGEYVPGAVFKVVYASNPRGYFDDGNGVVMRINSQGFRGPEVTEPKPANVFRIIGLGDSFTFGVGVREDHTFLRKLDGLLNSDGGKAFEVMNAGVQGYNTRDEVLYLTHRWLSFEPDLVLITFYLNDAYADDRILNNGETLGIYFRPAGLARISCLWDHFQHASRLRELSAKVEEYYKSHYFTQVGRGFRLPGERFDWPDCRRALAKAKSVAEGRKIRVALVIFPELFRLAGKYPFEHIHELVKNTCDELGIDVLDLLDSYRGIKEAELWVHPSDHHPNEVAHGIAAKAIHDFLVEVLPATGR